MYPLNSCCEFTRVWDLGKGEDKLSQWQFLQQPFIPLSHKASWIGDWYRSFQTLLFRG